MIFLSRDYEKDKDVIESKLSSYLKHKTPVWLVLYPEVNQVLFIIKNKREHLQPKQHLKLYKKVKNMQNEIILEFVTMY